MEPSLDIWQALAILKNGILASLVTALVCSFLGVYVILKRMVFFAAALSQVSSLGIAAALPLQLWLWGGTAASTPLFPVAMAILCACAAAALMAREPTEKRLSRESWMGIAYVVSGAVALLLLDSAGGTLHDINNLIFGNTVVVPAVQLGILIAVAALVLLLHAMFYKEFVFIAFDPHTARTCGLPVLLLNQLLFGSLAIMISVSINTVGILPVFAFMVVPPAAALMLSTTLTQAFVLAICFGAVAALSGFYLSYLLALPTGPTIIAVAALFLSAALAKRLFAR